MFYVELEKTVETVDTLADVKKLPVGHTVNELESEALLHTQAGTLEKMTH